VDLVSFPFRARFRLRDLFRQDFAVSFGGADVCFRSRDGVLVAAAPMPLLGVPAGGERACEFSVRAPQDVLVVAEISSCSFQRLASVVRQRVDQVVKVDPINGPGAAEMVDAEGERVVGAYGLECDVGPMVGELTVDRVGTSDTPAVFSVPRGSLGHGGL
jgi:hypothetical protein